MIFKTLIGTKKHHRKKYSPLVGLMIGIQWDYIH